MPLKQTKLNQTKFDLPSIDLFFSLLSPSFLLLFILVYSLPLSSFNLLPFYVVIYFPLHSGLFFFFLSFHLLLHPRQHSSTLVNIPSPSAFITVSVVIYSYLHTSLVLFLPPSSSYYTTLPPLFFSHLLLYLFPLSSVLLSFFLHRHPLLLSLSSIRFHPFLSRLPLSFTPIDFFFVFHRYLTPFFIHSLYTFFLPPLI